MNQINFFDSYASSIYIGFQNLVFKIFYLYWFSKDSHKLQTDMKIIIIIPTCNSFGGKDLYATLAFLFSQYLLRRDKSGGIGKPSKN